MVIFVYKLRVRSVSVLPMTKGELCPSDPYVCASPFGGAAVHFHKPTEA